MSVLSITTVLEARAAATEWLITHLPDRFAAGIPEYDPHLSGWRVPVWLSYPQMEPLGPVGELVIDEESGSVKQPPPLDELRACALKLYQQHRAQIEAPLP